MKLLIISLIAIVGAVLGDNSPFYLAPGEITSENFSDFSDFLNKNARISSGVAGRRGENLDFCYISVRFQQKSQTCSCVVMDNLWVATSARCVIE